MRKPSASWRGAAGICATAVLSPFVSVMAADNASAPARSESAWIALARGRVDVPGGIIQIAASRDGILKEILVDEGDRVEKDAVLATLDETTAQLGLAVAKRDLAQVEATLVAPRVRQTALIREIQRLEKLVAEKLANAQELDQARDNLSLIEAEIAQATLAVESARARIAVAQYEIDLRTIRAPVAGIILRRLVRPGEGTSTFNVTPLFWLAPNGPRIVHAELDEDAAQVIAPGQLAEVVTEGSVARTIKAKVQRVGLFYGPKRPATDDPAERQDVRVVDCVLTLEEATPPVLIGQRVVVRFLRMRATAP